MLLLSLTVVSSYHASIDLSDSDETSQTLLATVWSPNSLRNVTLFTYCLCTLLFPKNGDEAIVSVFVNLKALTVKSRIVWIFVFCASSYNDPDSNTKDNCTSSRFCPESALIMLLISSSKE